MAVKIRLVASEAQYEAVDGNPAPIPTHQPQEVVIGPFPEDWVELTYNSLRSAPDGDTLAFYDDGFWVPERDFDVLEATFVWGDRVPHKNVSALQVSRMKFSDITILFEKE